MEKYSIVSDKNNMFPKNTDVWSIIVMGWGLNAQGFPGFQDFPNDPGTLWCVIMEMSQLPRMFPVNQAGLS